MLYHAFEILNQKIIVDPNTEAVLSADEAAFDWFIYRGNETEKKDYLIEKYGEKVAKSTLEDINYLFNEGILARKKLVYTEEKPERSAVIKALCLHVAHACDLHCKYCFASQGDFKGQAQLMDEKTGKRALDFLVENSGNRRNLEVDFFGGEPLLNFDLVEKLTLYGHKLNEKYNKNIRFTLTTNGLSLDRYKIDFINAHMDNVVLSLDGRKEIHDRMRPNKAGEGSYDKILPKFKELLENRGDKDSFIRGTFTRYNLDFYKDVIHYFNEGFEKVSMEPVVTDPALDYAIRKEDLEIIFNSYENLAREFKERRKENSRLEFFHFKIDLDSGPCLAKKLSGCGAGTEYIAVTPKGEIYPCHQFVGEKEFIMGDIFKGINNEKLIEEFSNLGIEDKEECLDCWCRHFCGGGCHANAWFNEKNLKKPYSLGCEMQKKRTEIALGLCIDE